MASPQFSLASTDLKKIGVGLALAVVGAVAAWITTDLIPAMEGSRAGWAVTLAPIMAGVANVLRKWISDTRPPPTD